MPVIRIFVSVDKTGRFGGQPGLQNKVLSQNKIKQNPKQNQMFWFLPVVYYVYSEPSLSPDHHIVPVNNKIEWLKRIYWPV